MRTTIELPDELFRRVKSRAALDGVTLKELFHRYVVRGLASESARSSDPIPKKRSDLPILGAASKVALPNLSNAELDEILEREEIADARAD